MVRMRKVIEISFDADTLPYRKLLEFFFQIHDPTTRNRQGNDIGMSYRSAIFLPGWSAKRSGRTLTLKWRPLISGRTDRHRGSARKGILGRRREHQNYLQNIHMAILSLCAPDGAKGWPTGLKNLRYKVKSLIFYKSAMHSTDTKIYPQGMAWPEECFEPEHWWEDLTINFVQNGRNHYRIP